MPFLDVTDVLYDPDFADQFNVLRTTQTISSGGVASDGPPNTIANVSGVVQPDKGRSLQRLDTGEHLTDAIKIYTQFGLTVGVAEGEADQVQWHGGTYVVVSVRDWRGYGSGFIEAVADLTDINPATDFTGGNQAGVIVTPPNMMPAAVNVGGGQIRYSEATGSPPVQIAANTRTLISFVIDPTQTQDYLNPPFAGNVSFDGTTITPYRQGDFYFVLVNLLVTPLVTGGQMLFDIDVGSPTGPTTTDDSNLGDAGVTQRISGKLFSQDLNYFQKNGAKLYVTPTVPVSVVNEAVLIAPLST